MVTKTTNHDDDLPTHDAWGTDLVRVRNLLAAGYSESLIAQAMGLTTNRIREALIVATGDRQGSPTPEQIAALCAEIQAGWTEEQATAAKHGEPRLSSRVVRPDADAIEAGRVAKVAAYWAQRRRERLEKAIPVRFMPHIQSDKRWKLQLNACGRAIHRYYATREEAEAEGRAWLQKVYEGEQAEACSGR